MKKEHVCHTWPDYEKYINDALDVAKSLVETHGATASHSCEITAAAIVPFTVLLSDTPREKLIEFLAVQFMSVTMNEVRKESPNNRLGRILEAIGEHIAEDKRDKVDKGEKGYLFDDDGYNSFCEAIVPPVSKAIKEAQAKDEPPTVAAANCLEGLKPIVGKLDAATARLRLAQLITAVGVKRSLEQGNKAEVHIVEI